MFRTRDLDIPTNFVLMTEMNIFKSSLKNLMKQPQYFQAITFMSNKIKTVNSNKFFP